MDHNRVLVTGGAGYVGSHVALALRDAGIDVVVLDDLSAGSADAVPAGTDLVRGSVGDAPLLAELLDRGRFDAVLHFAASVSVQESVGRPLRYYENNTAATLVLVKACCAAGIRHIVYSSTAAVYGVPDRLPIGDDAPTAPINPYGASKLAGEWLLRDAAAAHGLRYAALRYFNVAGADPEGRLGQISKSATHLIKIACQAATGQRPEVAVFGDDYPTPDGTCIRDYIHVADLAAIHLAALRHLLAGGESLTANCAYGRGFSVREVLEVVAAVAGSPLPVRVAPRRPGDPPQLYATGQRARQILGWQPAYDRLPVIVRSALDWERRLVAAGGRLPPPVPSRAGA